ncbi:MAG: four helix bundle protein [Microgenomates group bacterium]|jgi:four helix bundle protein|nr:four helix bundle protein [Candidatus Woesebacteria bacterium]QQR63715.1 MAG: four helix bundle protein [Candidatus Roizmanbacteria bacterium]
MKITRFEDFPIWKESIKVVKEVYKLTSNKYFSKDFGLRDQLRRASVSINSNIVEGFEKNNNNEFIRYLKIAKGSSGEVRSQMYISREIDYVTEEEFVKISNLLDNLSRQIGGFINYLTNKRINKEFITKN